MATAAGTTPSLGHGNGNKLKFGGIAAEVHNIVDASVAAADTWTFTTALASVKAIIGMPYPEFTWAQSGETVTITIANDGETWTNVNIDLLFIGSPF